MKIESKILNKPYKSGIDKLKRERKTKKKRKENQYEQFFFNISRTRQTNAHDHSEQRI